jgi:hypothetical protein
MHLQQSGSVDTELPCVVAVYQQLQYTPHPTLLQITTLRFSNTTLLEQRTIIFEGHTLVD